jgi:hypothetical protein
VPRNHILPTHHSICSPVGTLPALCGAVSRFYGLTRRLMSVMKFLKHIRSKSKVKDKKDGQTSGQTSQYYAVNGHDTSARLPPLLLQRIFIEVCPLTVDDTYDSSEESLVDYGCALCDVKNLAQCALVSRKWFTPAQSLL